MLKIAFCDDDDDFVSRTSELIQSILRSENNFPVIATYTNPAALTSAVADDDRYDLYILDVQMPGMDGFEVAKCIRENQPNAALLFLSSHPDFAMEGYKVRALRYIYKLDIENALPEALKEAIETIRKDDLQSIIIQHYQNFTRILYRDIIYVQKVQRNVEIVTDQQGIYKDSRGIKQLFSEINDSRFIFTDRAYFVNLDYVQELNGSSLVMTNGEHIPVSRPMMTHVKKAMINLWGGNNKS